MLLRVRGRVRFLGPPCWTEEEIKGGLRPPGVVWARRSLGRPKSLSGETGSNSLCWGRAGKRDVAAAAAASPGSRFSHEGPGSECGSKRGRKPPPETTACLPARPASQAHGQSPARKSLPEAAAPTDHKVSARPRRPRLPLLCQGAEPRAPRGQLAQACQLFQSRESSCFPQDGQWGERRRSRPRAPLDPTPISRAPESAAYPGDVGHSVDWDLLLAVQAFAVLDCPVGDKGGSAAPRNSTAPALLSAPEPLPSLSGGGGHGARGSTLWGHKRAQVA